MPVLLLPRYNSKAASLINGNAGERGTASPSQQLRQAAGPVGRATDRAQVRIGSCSSNLRPSSCQLGIRPVGQSPKETLQVSVEAHGLPPPYIWGNVSRDGIHSEQLPEV